MTVSLTRRLSAATAAATLTLGLVACGDDSDNGDGAGDNGADNGQPITFTEGYVGAKDADTPMTAVFGELTNTTDEDIQLTEVSGDLEGVYEYHEVVDGVMRETDDGITVPANDTLMMDPGGHHIMIMENHDEIAAGDVLNLTLTDDDGETYDLNDIPVRVQQSAHEDYEHETDGDQDEHGDHAGH